MEACVIINALIQITSASLSLNETKVYESFSSMIINDNSIDISNIDVIKSIISTTASNNSITVTDNDINVTADIIKNAYDDIKTIDINVVSLDILESLSEKNKAVLLTKQSITNTSQGNLLAPIFENLYIVSSSIWNTSVTSSTGTINSSSLVEPTRAEKGALILESLNISDASINAIGAVSLSISGTILSGLLFKLPSLSRSWNE